MGNFCGPTVSGILFDTVGFNYNCLILQVLVFVVFAFNIISFFLTPPSKTPSELDAEGLTPLTDHLTDRPDLIAELKTQWDAVDQSRQI